MRQTLSRGMVAAAAATGILSLCAGGHALADSHAAGAAKGSPGVLSGNNVQASVHVPVNACGNSVDVVAALDPAFGNSCVNHSDAREHRSHGAPYGDGDDSGYGDRDDSGYGDRDDSGYGDRDDSGYGDDSAYGDSGYGVSGYGDSGHENHGPGDDCGGYGDTCGGGAHSSPPPHGGGSTPPGGGHTSSPPHGGGSTPPGGGHTSSPPHGGGSTPPTHGGYTTPPQGGGHSAPPQLSHTGSNSAVLLAASGVSAALIAGGALLYRRGRAASRR